MDSERVIAGRYRLGEQLGSGGEGTVWKATDQKLNRYVALKRAAHGGGEAIARIESEGKKLAQVGHPNIVTVYDVVPDAHPVTGEEERWLVMEYLEGVRLSELSDVPVAAAARYGAQLAGGLMEVHEAGLLHRDVTPSNVIVTRSGQAKLVDFGITQPLSGLETLAGDARLIGTPGFLAPEVAEANDLSPAADVFGLGATLYYLMEGTSPYGSGEPQEVLNRTTTQLVIPPVRSGELTPLIKRMLGIGPRGRPSMERARHELAELAAEPSAGLGGGGGDVGVRPRKPRRRMILAGIGAVAGVLVVVGGVAVAADLLRGSGAGSNPSATASPVQAIGEPGAVGDETQADACGLLEPDALKEFGEVSWNTDNGIPNGCELEVVADDATVVVELKMWRSKDGMDGESRQEGVIGVVSSEEDMPEECDRDLVLPDDHVFALSAVVESGTLDDACEIADAAVEVAVARLNAGEVPRRLVQPPAGSVQLLDACELPGKAVAAAVGGEPVERTPGFARWDCSWDGPSGDDLRVYFQLERPPGADDGRAITLSGHPAYVGGDRWGEGSCLVDIVANVRPDAEDGSVETAELVRIHLEADGASPVELCNRATAVADAVASSL